MDRFAITLDELGFHMLAAACGEAGDAVIAKKLFARMQDGHLGFKAHAVDCGQLVKAFVDVSSSTNPGSTNSSTSRTRQLADAIAVLDWMDKEGILPSHQLFALLLPACANNGMIDVGRRLHARIRDDARIGVNNFLAAGLIGMYAKCGFLDDSIAVFDVLVASGQQPDENVVRAVINACRKCDQPDRALPFLYIERLGLLRDQVCFHLLTAACGEAGDAVIAKKLFARMQDGRLGFKVNAVDCGQLIKAFVAHNSSADSAYSSSKLADAIAVLDWMDKHGIPQSSHHFALVLSSCARNGLIDIGRQLHLRIQERSVTITDHVSSGLITMYSKCSFLEDASAVFEEMRCLQQAGEPQPGVSTWTAMIMAYGQHGHGKEALALFHAMKKENLALDDISLGAILSACSHAGLADEALQIYASMEDYFGIAPSLHHQNCIVDALSRAGRLAEAEEFIAKSVQQPDTVTWMALLGACRNQNDVARAERAVEHLRELAPGDAAPGVLLGNTYAATGRWEDMDDVRRKMKDEGVRKTPGVSWIVVGGKKHIFTVHDTSHPRTKDIHSVLDDLWNRIKAAGFVPNTSVVLRPMTDEAAKDHHLCRHSEKLAIAFGLLATPERMTLRIFQNLRMCPDCHEATKFIADLTKRTIIVRDANRFHCFENGECTCGGHW